MSSEKDYSTEKLSLDNSIAYADGHMSDHMTGISSSLEMQCHKDDKEVSETDMNNNTSVLNYNTSYNDDDDGGDGGDGEEIKPTDIQNISSTGLPSVDSPRSLHIVESPEDNNANLSTNAEYKHTNNSISALPPIYIHTENQEYSARFDDDDSPSPIGSSTCAHTVNDSKECPSPQVVENTCIQDNHPIYRPPPPYTSPNDSYYSKLVSLQQAKDLASSSSYSNDPTNNPVPRAATADSTNFNTSTTNNASNNIPSMDSESNNFNVSLVGKLYPNSIKPHQPILPHQPMPSHPTQQLSSPQDLQQPIYSNSLPSVYPNMAGNKNNYPPNSDIHSNECVQSIQYVHTSPQQYDSYFSSMPQNYLSTPANSHSTSVFTSPQQASSSAYPPGFCFTSSQCSSVATTPYNQQQPQHQPHQQTQQQQYSTPFSATPSFSQLLYTSPQSNSDNFAHIAAPKTHNSSHNSSISTPSPQNSAFSSQQSPQFASSPQQSTFAPTSPEYLCSSNNQAPSASYSQMDYANSKVVEDKSISQQNQSLVRLLSNKSRYQGPYKVNCPVRNSDKVSECANANNVVNDAPTSANYAQMNRIAALPTPSHFAASSSSNKLVETQQIVQTNLNENSLPLSAKKKKSHYSSDIIVLLEEAFKVNKYPTSSDRKIIQTITNLGADKVKTWFQNRRSKEIRIIKSEIAKGNLQACDLPMYKNSRTKACEKMMTLNRVNREMTNQFANANTGSHFLQQNHLNMKYSTLPPQYNTNTNTTLGNENDLESNSVSKYQNPFSKNYGITSEASLRNNSNTITQSKPYTWPYPPNLAVSEASGSNINSSMKSYQIPSSFTYTLPSHLAYPLNNTAYFSYPVNSPASFSYPSRSNTIRDINVETAPAPSPFTTNMLYNNKDNTLAANNPSQQNANAVVNQPSTFNASSSDPQRSNEPNVDSLVQLQDYHQDLCRQDTNYPTSNRMEISSNCSTHTSSINYQNSPDSEVAKIFQERNT